MEKCKGLVEIGGQMVVVDKICSTCWKRGSGSKTAPAEDRRFAQEGINVVELV